MMMSPRDRNRTGKHHTPFCGACCDGSLANANGVKTERRRAKRRERRDWKREV